MAGSQLDGAIISSEQILEISHPLAAANHRQWAVWEALVLRNPRDLMPEAASDLISRARAAGLSEMLVVHARMVVDLVGQFVRGFAYSPDLSMVVARKLEQFVGWVEYAVTKPSEARTRWLLQCRTPFLELPGDMQASDYVEAAKDLWVIADAGGLVLADPPPEFKPQTSQQLSDVMRQHKRGMHGMYATSERPWSNSCVGCHREWTTSY